LDIGVLGYIGIVQHKEHSPEVFHIPPGTPCIHMHAYTHTHTHTHTLLILHTLMTLVFIYDRYKSKVLVSVLH